MGVFKGSSLSWPKGADSRAFLAETFGSRRLDFTANLPRVGVARETWALQQTPMGSPILVWSEGGAEAACRACHTGRSTGLERSGTGETQSMQMAVLPARQQSLCENSRVPRAREFRRRNPASLISTDVSLIGGPYG